MLTTTARNKARAETRAKIEARWRKMLKDEVPHPTDTLALWLGVSPAQLRRWVTDTSLPPYGRCADLERRLA